MKNIFTVIVLAAITSVNAQVIIGDAVGTVLPVANKTSVLLEFANTSNKGIIVPYITPTLPTGTAQVGGSIILDATTPANARMKFYAGTDGWKDLSGQGANLTTPVNYLAAQPSGVTETGKSVIGAQSSMADGVLVLESNTKAMVLPIVANTDQIIKPSPGMMVYVKKTGAKRLAVFNGAKWSFWKP